MPDLEELSSSLSLREGGDGNNAAAPERAGSFDEEAFWEGQVKLKKARSGRRSKETREEADKDVHLESFVPGVSHVWIRTWGCTHNQSDGEYMAGLLKEAGYQVSLGTEPPRASGQRNTKEDVADVWVLNSCTVKTPSEQQLRNWAEMGKERGKAVVLAGCVPAGDGVGSASSKQSNHSKVVRLKDEFSVIGVRQIDQIVDVVEQTLQGRVVKASSGSAANRRPGAALDLPKVRKNPLVEIISINSGCLNQCTYCKTKHARGHLTSYPAEEIIGRVRRSFEEGVVEIWLTSEDTGAYGRDLGIGLPDLLEPLVREIPPGCRLRLGMTNPPYILDHLDAMAAILSHPRVYSFLHVPVQAGSDAVLNDMKRDYHVHHFSRIVDFLRQRVPGITIATDIICGFPTETGQDFLETLELCRKYKFPSLFINQFFPRPGTPAAQMKRVDTQEVKRRTKALSELFQSYSPYDNRRGEIHDVLITDMSHDRNFYVGHNKFYEQILVPIDPNIMGKMARVRIVSECKFSMTGQVLEAPIQDEEQEMERAANMKSMQMDSLPLILKKIGVSVIIIALISRIIQFWLI